MPLPKGWPKRIRRAVLQVISLAQASITFTRSWAVNSRNARVRLRAENERLRQELALLQEETRIKDARMSRIASNRRPHYPPIERMAILELRAARSWSMAQTAERFHITPATIASWMSRLDEEGANTLIQIQEPVKKFPDFVRHIVRRLKVLCPTMGKVKIAQVLARAGLHLAPTTVSRILKEDPKPKAEPATSTAIRSIVAKKPNAIWHLDLTTIPTSRGFWTPWQPFSLHQRQPFCWWVVAVIDNYSRRAMGVSVFPAPPSSKMIRAFLGRTIRKSGATPKSIITDKDKRFQAHGFRRWCQRKGIKQRFGAVGKHGSIAVIERFIRTLKQEGARRILIPYRRDQMRRELKLFTDWYNQGRPHTTLDGRTPNEVYLGKRAACNRPRYEPRNRWPTSRKVIRGKQGCRLALQIQYLEDRKHLPIVTLKRVA